MASKAIFKFNGGLGALLCSKCSVIIKTGKDFTDIEKTAIKGEIELSEQSCEKWMVPGKASSTLIAH